MLLELCDEGFEMTPFLLSKVYSLQYTVKILLHFGTCFFV